MKRYGPVGRVESEQRRGGEGRWEEEVVDQSQEEVGSGTEGRPSGADQRQDAGLVPNQRALL